MSAISFDGQTIVVTGAGHGLGRALAVAFSRCGGRVVLLSKTPERLEKTLSLMEPGVDHLPFVVNLENPLDIEAVCQQVASCVPAVDILINNAAGYWLQKPFHAMDFSDIHNMIDVTLRAPVLLSQKMFPLLRAKGGGRVLNILSTAALPGYCPEAGPPFAPSAVYCAAKGGLAAFTHQLRREWKAERIRVLGIYPGPFMNTSTLDDPSADLSQKTGRLVMGVQEIVEAVLFAVRAGDVGVDNFSVSTFF